MKENKIRHGLAVGKDGEDSLPQESHSRNKNGNIIAMEVDLETNSCYRNDFLFSFDTFCFGRIIKIGA